MLKIKILKKNQDWRTRMALAKKPVTGMRDITPAEMQIREYVMNQIKETYKSFGSVSYTHLTLPTKA